jgi:signal transduction histidine kinase/ligand-binding sensor domain-containing protein
MKKRFNPCLVSLLLVGFLLAETKLFAIDPLTDSAPLSEDYVLRAWNSYDGLPSNTIAGITQTPDGYLWIATPHGLARFDGVRYKSFLRYDLPELESNDVSTIFSSRDGALWLGFNRGGVTKLSEGHWETITPQLPLGEDTSWTSSFAEDAVGNIWFAYDPDCKAFRWSQRGLEVFTAKNGIGPGDSTYVYQAANRAIWFSTTEGCGVFDGKGFRKIDPMGGSLSHMAPSHDGSVWCVRQCKLLRYESDGTREEVADIGNAVPSVLYEDHSGDLWIGTKNSGLFRFRGGSFVRVPTSHPNISSIIEDREENLWVGTRGGGLDQLRQRRFFLRQKNDGLNDESIVSLCSDSEGKLWLIGLDGIPDHALDAANQRFEVPPDWVGGKIMDVLPDPAGGVWFGTIGDGLMHFGRDISFPKIKKSITSLLFDKNHNLWVSTIGGPLVCQHNGKNTYFPQEKGLSQVRALAEDGSGRIWIGTEGGTIFQMEKDQFVTIPIPGAKPDEPIRFIVPDINDTVWIGLNGGGLYRWRAGLVMPLAHNIGLRSDDLRALAIEPNGYFWFGTGSGLFCAKRHDINAAVDGSISSIPLSSYGGDDGLPGLDFSYGFRHATTQTQDGHLWFATYQGALEIDTQRIHQNPPLDTDSVLIEEVQLDNATQPIPANSPLILSANPRLLQIRYTLPQMSGTEYQSFRYRLLGLNAGNWVLANHERIATFTNLPPGDYRFEVAAAALDGGWLPNTASLPIRVEASWWQTRIFKAVVGLIVLLVLFYSIKKITLSRVRSRMLILEQEHALEQNHSLERERTRIARDLHDELGAKLTQIHIVSQMAQMASSEGTGSHIQEISDIVRRTIKLLREIVWEVDPQADTLPALIDYLGQYSHDYLSAAGIAFEMDIPDSLPPYPLSVEARHHLLLIIKETINNIVKHAHADLVKFKIELEGRLMRVAVSDNGAGFNIDSEPAYSNGLRNLRERMKALGGTCEIESAPGKGTRIILALFLAASGEQFPGKY